MKNLRINLLLIVALLVTAATFSAFTMIKSEQAKAAKSVDTVWYFTGTEAQIKDVELWRNTGSEPVDCAPSGDSPCSISVPAADEGELETYFSSLDPEEITDLSENKRP